MRRYILIVLVLLNVLFAMAQISSGGSPMAFQQSAEAAVKSAPSIRALGSMDIFTTLNVDTVYHPSSDFKKIVAGNVCSVDLTPYNSGTTFTANGYRVWRAGVTSKGAAAIGLVFTEFDIPEGARLFLYNPSQSIVLGSFSSVNNNKGGVLPVQPLSSDSVVVEYQEPLYDSNTFVGKLKIGYASHNFMDTNGVMKKTNPGKGIACSPQAFITEPQNLAVSATCLIYTTGSGQSWYASGTLINNPDVKPYLLSSYHVFEGSYAATSIFYFQNHMVMTGVNGSSELSIAGASKVSYAEDLDMALVELNQMPPKDYRPYMAGWDAVESQGYNSPYVCVHHPNGDFTKLSYCNSVTKSKTDFEPTLFKYQTFWKVSRWSEGATQGGSSGSALYNSDGRIIGCLTGGASNCDNPVNDYFWQMSAGWDFHADSEMRLKNWLDPHNQGITAMDGVDPYVEANPCKRFSNLEDDDVVAAQQLSGAVEGYQAGHNSLGCTAYAEHYSFNEDVELHGVYVGTFKGKYSSSHPVYVNVYAGGPTPGDLIGRVEFKPVDYSFKYDGSILTSTISSWAKRDSYVRFSTPIDLYSDFYVGVSFDDYDFPDTLALYQSTNRDSGNGAFYYSNGAWNSFENYPDTPQPASLWLDPVVSVIPSTPASEAIEDQKSYSVVADHDANILSLQPNSAEYVITDISGRRLASGTTESGLVPFTASDGVYIITFVTDSKVESHKFLWR